MRFHRGPTTISLELHFTTLPDLIHRAQGRIRISLFLRAAGSDRDEVCEEIVGRFLSLSPLLKAFLPEAEFVPVIDRAEIKRRKIPFKAADVRAIHRRQETFSPSAPLKRVALGFCPEGKSAPETPDWIRHIFPWIPSEDDWLRLMDVFMLQLDPVQLIVRICPGNNHGNTLDRLEAHVQACERILSGARESRNASRIQTKLVRNVMLKRLAGLKNHCFRMGVFLLSPRPIDPALANAVGRAITGPGCAPEEEDLFQGGFETVRTGVRQALDREFFTDQEPFTVSEEACAFRLPAPPLEEHAGLPIKRSRTAMACLPLENLREEKAGSIELFLNEHQGTRQPVRVNADDRMRHTFIIGQTGTGKSTLMDHMILQDIHAGKGLVCIDPHGDLVDSILGKIPPERADHVILFDMLDFERPLGFNLLEWHTIEERDLIIDDLYLTIDRIYDMKATGGPIFESNFRWMLKLLMGDAPRPDFTPTLLEFINCYLNTSFRNWLKDRSNDPAVLDYVAELERTGGDASLRNLAPYVTSKLSRYTSDTSLRRIVGQEKTSFDVEEVMNNGNILLMKLGKGRFGPTVSALLVNQIVSRFKTAVMKRGHMRPEARQDFFLYVDECHTLPRENFMELLSEARKFRVGLVLATQYAAQLGSTVARENDLLAAILGNVGTLLIFRLGQNDAVELSKAVYPYFSASDITGLPNWNGYAAMQLGGDPTPAFSFQTRKPQTPFDPALATKITALSRIKYGMDSGRVDEQILERRRLWKEE